MARFAYDVNTRTRLIDVYKQFNGGLKTVDTDDALGSVYLRQAENVSLSEFGFIEKRYGTIVKETIQQTNGTLQGFWEFGGFSIYAINNIFYYNGTQVTSIAEENNDYRYPTLPTYDSSTGFGGTTFRDMNAVNINSVLYIFTGHYPVYVKIVNNVPTFYWFSVTIPSYDEIVVTGHNLLEDDYDKVYGFTTPNDYQISSNSSPNVSAPKIVNTSYHPRFPFVRDESQSLESDRDGSLNFEFVGQFPQTINAWQPGVTSTNFKEIVLNKIEYKTHGSGLASYTSEANVNDTDYVTINNWNTSSTYPASSTISYVKHNIVGPEQAATEKEIKANLTATNYRTATALKPSESSSYSIIFDDTNYQIGHTFTIRKSDLLNSLNQDLAIRVYRGDDNSKIFKPFDLTEFNTEIDTSLTFGDGTSVTDAYNWYPVATPENIITFQGFDSSGIAISSRPVNALNVVVDSSSGAVKFKVPLELVNSSDGAAYYQVNFTQRVTERQRSPYNFLGPTDLDTTGDEYYFAIAVLGDKSPAPSGRLMTSSFIPSLKFKLNNLLAGTWDFRITFEIAEYTYLSSGLSYIGGNFFTTEIKNVTITPEKLQDLPGQTDDFLPKAKPIWSCNKVMEHYGKLLVWGSEDETNGMPTAVFYSFPDRPTYFPSKFYLDFTNGNSQPIEAVTPYMNILVAQTASQTWGIRGNSGLVDAPAPYVPFGINGTVGTIAYKSVRPVRNHLFFLSKQGVIALKSLYAADEQYNIEFVDRNIRNIVPQDSKAVGIQFDNQYWLNFPNNSITLRWYIDKKAWVKDVYQGYATNGFNGVFKYQIVNGKLEYITHPSETADVNNLTIYRVGVDYDIPTDLFQPISAKFETSFLNQNYPFHPKNYKEAKLDFTLQNEYNLGRDAIYDSARDTDFTTAGGGGTSAFLVTLPVAFSRNHRYRVEFTPESGSTVTHIPLTNVSIEGNSSYSSDLTAIGDASNTLIWEFNITNDYNQNAVATDFIATLSTTDASAIESIIIRDVTYDTNLAFSTYVISEDQTLNFNNYSGYDQATVDVDLDLTLKGQLGDWTFGESDFGKKITAVKTIKLSGKGYNAKVYVEDVSRSKWTLESMGLTYKMKRARSK